MQKKTETKGPGVREYEAILLTESAYILKPVAGKPFLTYVINYLRMQGVTRFVFVPGHPSGQVENFLKENFPTLSYAVVTEEEPLGTGAGIRLALQKIKGDMVLVVYGDTLFKADIEQIVEEHKHHRATCTLALKPMASTEKDETVVLDAESRIVSFRGKNGNPNGLINGGIYVLDKAAFFRHSFPAKFSFEKDFLELYCGEEQFYGAVQDASFTRISSPEGLAGAQAELAAQPLDLAQVDKSWTLFIDRDGVINNENVGEYVLHWKQFIFSKGVLQAFKKLGDVFGRLLLVTNQRGVGKGLMTKEALDSIHYEMQREIGIVGGHLDKIYYCTDVDNTSFYRKPNPGMAVLAKRDFPQIDFSKSIMVGNKPSDMRFGRAAGMYTVFLATTNPDLPFPHPDIDLRFADLASFASALR